MERSMTAKATGDSRRIKVTISGESYVLISDEPEEQVQSAVYEVNVLMDEIARHSGIIDTRKVAVLAALQCVSQKRVVEHKLLTSINTIIDSI